MDQMGIYYQVMYPNILGFHSHVFLTEMPRELATECVRAYNDWLTVKVPREPPAVNRHGSLLLER
jgi:hypothetical protein